MIVIIKEPGKPGRKADIPNTLETLQQVVGGYVEVIRIASDMYAIVDEEGKPKGKPANILGLVGTVVFCGGKEEGIRFTDCPRADKMIKLIDQVV